MVKKTRWIAYFSVLLLGGMALSGCVSPLPVYGAPYINLDNRAPLPQAKSGEIKPLKVAIAAVISPQGLAESYAPLLEYLESALGRPVEVVQRRTYSEINDLLVAGEVDVAFVCTSSYLAGRQFGLQLLAAPQVDGKVTYRAKVIVSAGSLVQSMEDLRGKVFAFTDPISFTGRVYPTYLLQQMGERPETFFARTFFTYSHDDAIYAVAHGVADGASVDALVLDFALKRDPELASRIRVIHTSEPFGMPPVVVGPHISPHLKVELQEIMLSMHLDPAGQRALDVLDYDRFVMVQDQDYRTAEVVASAVESILDVKQ